MHAQSNKTILKGYRSHSDLKYFAVARSFTWFLPDKLLSR